MVLPISGWMTEGNFVNYLKHFVKYSKCSVNNKVLLLTDNHESHISLPAVDFARANGIIILTFPPHCSHRLQPLDVAVYSSFKGCYNTQLTNRLMLEKPGVPLTIYDIAGLVGKAFPQSFTPSNILSAFNSTGIWPFNENIFTDSDFMCSAVTDRPNPDEATEQNVSQSETLGKIMCSLLPLQVAFALVQKTYFRIQKLGLEKKIITEGEEKEKP